MAACALLLGIGNLVLVNALQYKNLNAAIIYLIGGIAVAAAVYFCRTKRLLKAAPYLLFLELLLLLICPLSGRPVNGATRWLRFGSLVLAPAMLAMPVLCLFWAYIKERSAENISRKNWIILLTTTLLSAFLVLIEPFISVAFFIIALAVVMLYLSGINRKSLTISVITAVIVCAASFFAVCQSNPYHCHANFFNHYFNYDQVSTYHSWISLKTLKHSVFAGKCQFPPDMEQTLHIPNAIADSALVSGCGRFGYVFLIAALLPAAALIACGVITAKRCKNPADRLLAAGMTAVIALPALTSTLMISGVLPMGGVAFPFLSYGGSAMIANALALGCLIAICRDTGDAME